MQHERLLYYEILQSLVPFVWSVSDVLLWEDGVDVSGFVYTLA